jgi:hypothetical protein
VAFSCLHNEFSKSQSRGNRMRFLKVSPLLVVSVVVFVVSVCCILSAVAEPPGRLWNQVCATMSDYTPSPNPGCDEVAYAICGQGVNGADCSHCSSSTAIPKKTCVPLEGASCLMTGEAAKLCSGGLQYVGVCKNGLCNDVLTGACSSDQGARFPCSQ